MNNSPFISICIPAYNRLNYLKRLLNSIEQQNFRNFEVIITDDSSTNEVEEYILITDFKFSLHYYKNQPALGTPRNWMEGIKYASGEWIKIMHDDDWFSSPDSLQIFSAMTNSGFECIFSGYYAFYEDKSRLVNKTISSSQFKKVKVYPYYLFGKNIIGPPSVLLFKKGIEELYDPILKWLVDLEAYIRMINKYNCTYIASPLITMSYNDSQVTNDCFQNPDIEVKEALIYYKKNGAVVHKKLMAYDAWWRMLRNLNIRTEHELMNYAKGETVPSFLLRILKFQKRLPVSLLKIGVASKLFMTFSFFFNR